VLTATGSSNALSWWINTPKFASSVGSPSGTECEVIDGVSRVLGCFYTRLNVCQYRFGRVETLDLDLQLRCPAQLTIDAGIGADFWGDIVDPQAAPQSSGGHRSECEFHTSALLMVGRFGL
jgi:hypothetical protein